MSHDGGLGREQVGWREWLSLYSDLLQIASVVLTVVLFLTWLIGWLPGILLAVLVSFCLGVFFVFMLAKVFTSNSGPVESIGAHLRTASLEAHRDEGRPVQLQGAVTLREARRPSAAPSQSVADGKPELNLLCGVINHLPAHEEYGVLVEGHAEGNSDAFVFGVKISNEFVPSRKVGSLSDVSAQIFYTPPDGQTLRVLRGTWLSEGRYQVDFGVNREHSLIIAGTPRRVTQGAQLVFYLRREISDSDKGVVDRIGPLGADSYRVKIRLITESEGVVHGEFSYRLTVVREPVFKIELTEDKQQAAPPFARETITPAAPAAQASAACDREAIVRGLRDFQKEGRRLLENSVNNTLFRERDFHRWEEEAETFIRENVGDAQANEFITDDPIIPYRNPYSLLNAGRANLINTRLERLGSLISRMQRS